MTRFFMTPNTAAIGALNEFLNYGPIGFAGLMLVLVIIRDAAFHTCL